MAEVNQQPPAQLSSAQLEMTQGAARGGTSRAAAKISNQIARLPEQVNAATLGSLAERASALLKKLILPK